MLLDLLVHVSLQFWFILKLLLTPELHKSAPQFLILRQLRWSVFTNNQMSFHVERRQLLQATLRDIRALRFLLRNLPPSEIIRENIYPLLQLCVIYGARRIFFPGMNLSHFLQ